MTPTATTTSAATERPANRGQARGSGRWPEDGPAKQPDPGQRGPGEDVTEGGQRQSREDAEQQRKRKSPSGNTQVGPHRPEQPSSQHIQCSDHRESNEGQKQQGP